MTRTTKEQFIDFAGEEPEEQATLLPTYWLMFTTTGFYPIQPSSMCKAEDHGRLNDHLVRIEDAGGNVLWKRVV